MANQSTLPGSKSGTKTSIDTTEGRSTPGSSSDTPLVDDLDVLLTHLARHTLSSAGEASTSPRSAHSVGSPLTTQGAFSPIEALIAASRGNLAPEMQEAFEDALAADPVLQDLAAFTFTGELDDPEPLAPPARLLEKIYPMMAEKQTLWTMAVRFAQKGLELISTTGELLAMRPMAVRSGQAQASNEAQDRISIRQALEGFDAVLTIERQSDQKGELRATTSLELREAGLPTAQDFEIELWQEQALRGVRSSDNGAVSFTGLRPGHYRLVLQLEGVSKGQLEFDLSV